MATACSFPEFSTNPLRDGSGDGMRDYAGTPVCKNGDNNKRKQFRQGDTE